MADLNKYGELIDVECPGCAKPIKPDWIACPRCGRQLPQETNNCSQCSALLKAGWKVCPECGKRIKGGEPDTDAAGQSSDTQTLACLICQQQTREFYRRWCSSCQGFICKGCYMNTAVGFFKTKFFCPQCRTEIM